MCPALRGESLLAVPRLSADRGRTRARAHSLRSSRVRNHGLRAPTALPALCLRCQHRYFQETQGAPCSAALPPEPTPRPATVTPQRPGTEHRAGKHAFCASGLPERAASPPGTGSERSGAGARRDERPAAPTCAPPRTPGRRGRTELGAGRPPPPACPPRPPPRARRRRRPLPPAFTFSSGPAAALRLRGPGHPPGSASGLPEATGAAPARPPPFPPAPPE